MNETNRLDRANIAKTLTSLRKEKGLSVEDLAELSNLDIEAINALEQGKVKDIDIILQYMDHIKINLDFNHMDEEGDCYYKYLKPERIDGFFNKGFKLRITQPSDLNDPFELMPKQLTDSELRELFSRLYSDCLRQGKISREEFLKKIEKLNSTSNLEEYAKQHDSMVRLKLDKTMGIVSFSKRWNNCIMWENYSEKHTGFCLGFDKTCKAFKSEVKNSGYVRHTQPVDYNNERQPFSKGLYDSNRLEFLKHVEEIIFRKAKDWMYEREVRMLVSFYDLKSEGKADSGLDLYLHEMGKSSLKEIYIGAKTCPTDKEILIENANKLGIKVFSCFPSTNNFLMDRECLN